MIRRTILKLAIDLSYITGFLALLVSLISVFSGEFYFQFVSEARVATYQGQDLLILASIPIFYWVINLAKKGSASGLFIWIALLTYFLYVYAVYAFNGIYSDLFLFYIAIISISFFSLIRLINSIDYEALHKMFSKKVPEKIVSIYFILIALIQAIIWVSIIYQQMSDNEPAAANAIFVIDLAFLLPTFMLSAYWLWRKHLLGYILSPVLLIFTVLYGLALISGQIFKYFRQVDYHPLPTYILIIFTFIALVLSLVFLNSKENKIRKTAKKK